MAITDCPTTEELSLFLSDQLAIYEKDDIEIHLSRCRQCRHLLATLHSHSRSDVVSDHAPWWLKARARAIAARGRTDNPGIFFGLNRQMIAAAAIILAVASSLTVFLFVNKGERHIATSDPLRQEEQVISAPQLIAPHADAVLATDEIKFHWSGVEGAQGYRFTLLNEKGDILFESLIDKQHLSLSANQTRLEHGKPYFWYVAARSAYGTTVDSTVSKFALSE